MIALTKPLYVSMRRDNVACFSEELAWFMYDSVDLIVTRDSIDKSDSPLFDKPPLISVAAYYGASCIFTYLVANGADCQLVDGHGRAPAHFAAIGGSVHILQRLEEIGCSLRERDKHGKSPCHYAAEYGQLDVIRWLWAIGENMEAIHDLGWTCLHFAAWNGHTNVVNFMLENGTDPNQPTRHGETALQFASVMGFVEIVHMLLAKGARVRGVANDPVFWAAKGGKVDVLRVLLSFGGDVNATSVYGETAAMIAARSGFADVLDLLLQSGADPTRTDPSGRTVFFKARNQAHIVNVLKAHGITH